MKGCFHLTFTLILVLFLVTGCATTQDHGKLIRSMEVEKLVESATVLANHTYYYTGPEAEPDAIVAIKDKYTFKSKYWIKVDAVEKYLIDWNRFIENDTRIRYFYEGARILTPEGEEAGLWYSTYDHTVIRFPDPTSIIIYAPLVPFESRERNINRYSSPDGF